MMRIFLLSLYVLIATAVSGEAQDIRTAQTTALRLTIAEAVLATTAQLSDRVGSPIKEVNWSSELVDRNWSLNVRGSSERGPIEIGFGGFLWGKEGEDWVVNFSGAGRIGGEPIQINGKMDWPTGSSDRLTINFNQVTKFGEHSTWNWILGTEMVAGASIVGGAAVFATAAIPPLAALAFAAGALGGASSAVSISRTIREMVEGTSPPPPPPTPPALLPKKEDRLTPQADVLFVSVTKDGTVTGNGPDPRYTLYGKTEGATMSGGVISR
jgi:hypothetical protein